MRCHPALDIALRAREEARLIGPGERRVLEGKRSVIGRAGLPVARAGMAVGLLGGSFDPAHAGHAHITREALKRLGLDRVWWLVSPGNPLKAHGPAPMADRLAAARAVMRHPRVTVTDIEARIGTRFTAETLARLQALYPGVHFVWLMGADNLAGLHRWERWPEIAARVPMAVFARPGAGPAAQGAKAARRLARWRVAGSAAAGLARRSPPAWAFLEVPKRDISSTRLRARGDWRS
jgi:nicotinate-nucleotide adenylyltransferase